MYLGREYFVNCAGGDAGLGLRYLTSAAQFAAFGPGRCGALTQKSIQHRNVSLTSRAGNRQEDRHSDGFLPPTRHQLA